MFVDDTYPLLDDSIQVAPQDIASSVDKWGFHFETVKQFHECPEIPPENTTYFRGVKEYRKCGGTLWKECTNDRAIIVRVRAFRRLFQRIRSDGYDIGQPISVNVERDGHIIVFDGHHRAAIAKFLGIQIPAHVRLRHPDWLSFVNAAWEVFRERKLCHPINHPEFANWNVLRDASGQARQIVKLEDDWHRRSVLDFGARRDGIAFHLADAGALVTVVDNSSMYLRVARMVDERLRAGKPKITWTQDVAVASRKRKWDWVLCRPTLHQIGNDTNGEFLDDFGPTLSALCSVATRGAVVDLATSEEFGIGAVDVAKADHLVERWLHRVTFPSRWERLLGQASADQEGLPIGVGCTWVRQKQQAATTAPL